MKSVAELKKTPRKGITATSASDLYRKSFEERIDVAAGYYKVDKRPYQ